MGNIKNYPANWSSEIVPAVRERSGNRCECMGECGLHSTTGRCIEIHGAPAQFAGGRVILTTAHLCQCSPLCGNLQHLKHMCNRCHLRIDVKLHQRHRRENRERAVGQQRLFSR